MMELSVRMNITFRDINKNDYSFLREALYDSLFIPEGEKPFPKTIIDTPEIAKYIKNWRPFKDLGLIAQYNNEPIGAIWCRLFNEHTNGYGFIDNKTPEIGISIKSEYRNNGIGKNLLSAFFNLAKLNGYKALSLSVDKRSPAVNFYKRMGFEIIYEMGTAYTMKKEM